MPIIEHSTRIAAPRAHVWDRLIDLERQPDWMHDLVSLRVDTPGPLRVGTLATGTVRMFGLTQADPVEVTALDAPSRYAIAHIGGFTGYGEFRLDAVDGEAATWVTWHEELTPTIDAFPLLPRLARLPRIGGAVAVAGRAIARLADPCFTPMFSYVFRKDLERFRRFVETGRA
jgi:hypothetical protein